MGEDGPVGAAGAGAGACSALCRVANRVTQGLQTSGARAACPASLPSPTPFPGDAQLLQQCVLLWLRLGAPWGPPAWRAPQPRAWAAAAAARRQPAPQQPAPQRQRHRPSQQSPPGVAIECRGARSYGLHGKSCKASYPIGYGMPRSHLGHRLHASTDAPLRRHRFGRRILTTVVVPLLLPATHPLPTHTPSRSRSPFSFQGLRA